MKEKFSIPAVAGIIEKKINNVDHILIQERWKENNIVKNGVFEIPGGKVREHENIFISLRREIKEETGLDITLIDSEENSITYNKLVNYTPFSCTQSHNNKYSIILESFICKAEGMILDRTEESRNIHFISLNDLKDILENSPEKIFEMHVGILKKYLEHMNYY